MDTDNYPNPGIREDTDKDSCKYYPGGYGYGYGWCFYKRIRIMDSMVSEPFPSVSHP